MMMIVMIARRSVAGQQRSDGSSLDLQKTFGRLLIIQAISALELDGAEGPVRDGKDSSSCHQSIRHAHISSSQFSIRFSREQTKKSKSMSTFQYFSFSFRNNQITKNGRKEFSTQVRQYTRQDLRGGNRLSNK
jgi:hypothetical protein